MYLATKPGEIADRLADRAIVIAAQILGVEPRRQRGRADKIAEHNRQLPPFGVGLNRRGYAPATNSTSRPPPKTSVSSPS